MSVNPLLPNFSPCLKGFGKIYKYCSERIKSLGKDKKSKDDSSNVDIKLPISREVNYTVLPQTIEVVKDVAVVAAVETSRFKDVQSVHAVQVEFLNTSCEVDKTTQSDHLDNNRKFCDGIYLDFFPGNKSIVAKFCNFLLFVALRLAPLILECAVVIACIAIGTIFYCIYYSGKKLYKYFTNRLKSNPET